MFPKWVSQASHFFGGPSLSISDQNWGRDSVGKAASIVDQLLVTHLLYTVQDLLAQQDSPVSEIVFTLFSFFFLFFFWWTRSLHLRDQEWVRDFVSEANSIVGQLLVTHLLYTVQDLFSAAWQFCFRNSFHTLLLFSVDQVWASQIRTEEQPLLVKLTPLQVSN